MDSSRAWRRCADKSERQSEANCWRALPRHVPQRHVSSSPSLPVPTALIPLAFAARWLMAVVTAMALLQLLAL